MRVLLKVLGGSRAYGLSHKDSDWDFKGCFIHERDRWFSMTPLETIWERKAGEGHLETIGDNKVASDVSLFEIRNFFQFLIKNNPNVLESLFVKERDVVFCDDAFKDIVAKRHLFLSKKTQESFVGYAIAQIKRAQTHRKWLLDPPLKQPTREDFELPAIPEFKKDQQNAFLSYLARMIEYNKKYFLLLDQAPDLLLRDMVCSTPSDKISELGEIFGLEANFIDLLKREKAYEQALKNWNSYKAWQKNRNEKRYELEKIAGYDSKNIMHCIRLLIQAKEILSTQDLMVDRSGIDDDYLRSIKQGDFSYDEIISISETLREEIKTLSKTSTLRERPDEPFIEGLYKHVLLKLNYIS